MSIFTFKESEGSSWTGYLAPGTFLMRLTQSDLNGRYLDPCFLFGAVGPYNTTQLISVRIMKLGQREGANDEVLEHVLQHNTSMHGIDENFQFVVRV